MPNPLIGVAGISAVSGVIGANKQAQAAQTAADAQSQAALAGVAEQQRQFDKVQQLLQPFVQTGTYAFRQAAALAGNKGAEAEQTEINRILQGPQYQTALQEGEEAILSNAAATGGLRGGDTQAALSEFAPSLLSQLVNQRYEQLAQLGTVGQASAAGVGSAAQTMGSNVSNLLQQQGAAQAGGALAQGKAFQQGLSGITSGLGTVLGAGGLSVPAGQTAFSQWGF